MKPSVLPANSMPYPIPGYGYGIPDSAYKDSSGDKPTPIQKPHFREYFRDWLVMISVPSAFIKLAWIFLVTGSPATHAAIMLTVISVGLISGMLSLVSVAPESKVKLKGKGLRWSFTVFLGIATALILHYALFG